MGENKNQPQQPQQPQRNPKKKRPDLLFFLLIILTVVALWTLFSNLMAPKVTNFTLQEFQVQLAEGDIVSAVARPTGGENYGLMTIEGVYKGDDGKEYKYLSLIHI